MKTRPVSSWTRHYPWLHAEMTERYAAIRSDALRRLANAPTVDDGRRGFGTVYVRAGRSDAEFSLSYWAWRPATAEHHPERLGARLFSDDPIGTEPRCPLAWRAAAADAFAAAANAHFVRDDGRFLSHRIEVVEADARRLAGLTRDGDADVLAVDLMRGMPNSRIIDRFVEEEHRNDRNLLCSALYTPSLREGVWHRVERLNEVRAMLDPGLPPVKLPGEIPIRRRVAAAYEECERRRAAASRKD